MTVRRIRGLVEGAGNSAKEMTARLDLDVADVYGALEYYHSHPEEMAAAEERRAEREATARESGSVSVAELTRDDE